MLWLGQGAWRGITRPARNGAERSVGRLGIPRPLEAERLYPSHSRGQRPRVLVSPAGLAWGLSVACAARRH